MIVILAKIKKIYVLVYLYLIRKKAFKGVSVIVECLGFADVAPHIAGLALAASHWRLQHFLQEIG